MAMLAWVLLIWLGGGIAVAFFALCLIRGGRNRAMERAAETAALEAKSQEDARRAAVA